ncbi:MAG: iron-containing alcohol dehydrogenase [Armatimonadetes bacterium]|nr:iron-containing alcohol dehydrogenase [Armatimonadota bacterium]
MKPFNYFQSTSIHFGAGRVSEVGQIVSCYGKCCLLVTVPEFDAIAPIYAKVKKSLKAAGVEVAHFDGVIPNPTTEIVAAGAKMACTHKADVILGVGGGSSMDTAKAIAVEAAHEGSCWDYLFFKTPPTEKTLPVVAVSTTSGTGSQVTQVAVVTNTAERCKSALYNSLLYPKAAIVDPELMISLPSYITACTGWDAFTHAFEAFIHSGASPYTDTLALEAINLIVSCLPAAVSDGADIQARSAMAWADTLAGLCIANAGVTLPHGIGMAISGMQPHIAHGEALAVTYPAFTRYTYTSAIDRFAAVGRILDPSLCAVSDKEAAEQSCIAIDNFLKEIGLWLSFKKLKFPQEEIAQLAKASMVLPDYKNNPRIATLEEIHQILKDSYQR